MADTSAATAPQIRRVLVRVIVSKNYHSLGRFPMRMRCLAVLGLLSLGQLIAAPVSITVQGNFGPSTDASTIFDNQNYVLSFVIPTSGAPDEQIVAPDIDQFTVGYLTSAYLSVPGIGLFTTEAIRAEFNSQLGRNWMNVFEFRNIPVGDFLIAVPVETLSGTPLWNGQAGSFGTPAFFSLNSEPASAFWRLQYIPPGEPASLPLASYPLGTASLTIAAVPEPSTIVLLGFGAAMLSALNLVRPGRRRFRGGK